MGIVCAAHSPNNLPMWLVNKSHDSWHMMVDYCELNTVVPHLHGAVPPLADLIDGLNHELGTYHFVADLANASFSVAVTPGSLEQFAFMLWPAEDIHCSPAGTPA